MATAIARYYKTAAVYAAGHFVEGYMFLPDYILRLVRVILLLSIWRIVLADKGTVSGMTLSAVLTYTLVSESFAEVLACRTPMPWELEDGRITTRYLRPMWVFGQFIAETFGGWVVSFSLFSIPLFAISPLLGVNPLPASASAGIWFIVSLLLAMTIGFAIDFIFSAVVILMQYNQYGVTRMREAITVLLSGAILPLALMPWRLGDILGWLPFASMASAPLRIYTGTGDPMTLVPIQITWVIVIWPAALLLWRFQRESLVSFGG